MIAFICNSILLGVGLAMDAFSVSLANGLNEPAMKKRRQCLIAGTYGFFQFIMPIIGWFCVHTIVGYFRLFEPFIPWIALILLVWIGGSMIREARKGSTEEVSAGKLTMILLLGQGVATSIDALSVGFAITAYDWQKALACALIIAAVTFVICIGGLLLGRRFGTRLAGKAGYLGGIILILIGLEIFIRGVLL